MCIFACARRVAVIYSHGNSPGRALTANYAFAAGVSTERPVLYRCVIQNGLTTTSMIMIAAEIPGTSFTRRNFLSVKVRSPRASFFT